jgi:hypothetical protein
MLDYMAGGLIAEFGAKEVTRVQGAYRSASEALPRRLQE